MDRKNEWRTMNTYLVTGAAGFIGSHTVEALLASGQRVVGVDNFRTGSLANLSVANQSMFFELVMADAGDEEAMLELFSKHRFSGVLHLAALVSVPESLSDPALNYRLNLATADVIARCCLVSGCPRLVFASSAAVYGMAVELPHRETVLPQPHSPYGAAKLAAEVMLLGYAASYGLNAVCLRYFNVYGLRQDPGSPYSGVLSIFTERFHHGLPVTVYGNGEQTRDFISVLDVARANTLALINPFVASGRYNACTGNAISLIQVLELYQTLFPNAPLHNYLPERKGDILHSQGDPTSLKKVMNFTAEIPFQDGLRQLALGFSA
jgi:UDP-glucose 4-epimerase